MMLLLSLFVLALAAASPSGGQELQLQHNCPEFWFSFSGRCYKYVASRMTWADAELHCVSQESNLVSIHSLEEHNYVNRLIKHFDPAQAFTWIGLSDIHKEGAWMWSDGTKFDFHYWDDGQPDNHVDQNVPEHCGDTNFGRNHKWNDYQCSLKFPSVCASRKMFP